MVGSTSKKPARNPPPKETPAQRKGKGKILADKKDGEECSAPKKKRVVISHACEPCRKRKSKCDGVQPKCGTCRVHGTLESCEFDLDKDFRTKGALRNKIKQLTEEKDKLLPEVAELEYHVLELETAMIDILKVYTSQNSTLKNEPTEWVQSGPILSNKTINEKLASWNPGSQSQPPSSEPGLDLHNSPRPSVEFKAPMMQIPIWGPSPANIGPQAHYFTVQPPNALPTFNAGPGDQYQFQAPTFNAGSGDQYQFQAPTFNVELGNQYQFQTGQHPTFNVEPEDQYQFQAVQHSMFNMGLPANQNTIQPMNGNSVIANGPFDMDPTLYQASLATLGPQANMGNEPSVNQQPQFTFCTMAQTINFQGPLLPAPGSSQAGQHSFPARQFFNAVDPDLDQGDFEEMVDFEALHGQQ